MDSDFNKPGTSTKPQLCVENSCTQEKTLMNCSTGCQEFNNEQNTNEEESYSLSSDDSEIIAYDDINIKPIENISSTDVVMYVSENRGKNTDIVINPQYLRQMFNDNEGLRKVLYRNHFMEPITFLLLLHDFGLELKLSKLIEDCGGLVYGGVKDIDGFTVVLVKDESLHWAYTGPVFKISYIAACFEARKVIDISPFFKSCIKTKFTKDFDFMSVIYFKKYTWDGVPGTSDLSIKMYTKSGNESRLCENDSDSDVPLIVEELEKKSIAGKKCINKHSRLPYSIKEDEGIITYIIKKQGYDNLRGNLFWKKMEERNICPHRTWQSMKEHFRKKIIFNLDCFKFISDNEKHLLQSSYM